MFSNGNAISLVCDSCNAEINLGQPVNLCPKCGGLLEVKYNIEGLKKQAHLFSEKVHDSIWRYREFFPAVADRNIVSLGEGGTPLVKSVHIGPSLGIENLYFKNDALMPTGSFKDRGYSLAVSYAKEIGVKRGLTYSSGNAGTSFSAYSARAGFPCIVMVDYLASTTKKSMILLYGATTTELVYQSSEQSQALFDKAVTELGCYMFVNFINPIRHEAMKTYAYEVYSELQRVPDFSFHPVGTGGGLWGSWKGYNELASIGVIDKLPRMVSVEPQAVCWLKNAIDSGAELGETFGDGTNTIAQSIRGNSPLHGGYRPISAVRDSGGMSFGVTDEEIMDAMVDLGREGIGAEPASAATVAAFKQAVKKGRIHSRETVVCTITGSALKQPEVVKRIASVPKYSIKADINELKALFVELHLL